MPNKFVSRLMASFATLTLAVAFVVAPALAQGQGSAKSAANAQRDKKPAATCDGMDKKSKAYSDCVKSQAQTTRTDKQTTKGADKSAGKSKAKKAN